MHQVSYVSPLRFMQIFTVQSINTKREQLDPHPYNFLTDPLFTGLQLQVSPSQKPSWLLQR